LAPVSKTMDRVTKVVVLSFLCETALRWQLLLAHTKLLPAR
jgi:hypothetical protein